MPRFRHAALGALSAASARYAYAMLHVAADDKMRHAYATTPCRFTLSSAMPPAAYAATIATRAMPPMLIFRCCRHMRLFAATIRAAFRHSAAIFMRFAAPALRRRRFTL